MQEAASRSQCVVLAISRTLVARARQSRLYRRRVLSCDLCKVQESKSKVKSAPVAPAYGLAHPRPTLTFTSSQTPTLHLQREEHNITMSAAGPALPPHLLAKRKRQQEEDEQNDGASPSGAKRSKSPEDGEKRRRVVGPAMPPAPLDQRPPEPANAAQDSDSEDDDGFGPALPPEDAGENAHEDDHSEARQTQREPTPEAKIQRDAWMTMAPQQDDLAARMDPTRQRPRGFNTGKGAKGPAASGTDATAWHETAEQKQKRLADEMMGISSKPAASIGPQRPPTASSNGAGVGKDAATAEKVKQARGPSLMEQHKATKGKEAEDDDPSARVFDREKDMGAGMRIGHAQREEMLKKAGGFASKFAGGSYL